jgi:membrane protein
LYLRVKKTVLYFLKRKQITGMEVYASHAAFYTMVSAVPLLLLSFMILRLLAPVGADEVFLVLKSYLPQQIGSYLPDDLFKNAGASSLPLLSLSALAMLWSSSRGINALSDGVRAVYGRKRAQGYFQKRVAALALTFALLFLFVLALVLLVLGETFLELLGREASDASGSALFLAVRLAPAVTFLLFCGVFTLMYKSVLADGSSLKEHFPGAAFAAGGWLFYSSALSFYLTHFMPSKYILYGSMGALVLLMLWVRALMTILLFGAELNVYFKERTLHCGEKRRAR